MTGGGCSLHAPTPCLAAKDCRPTTLIGGKGLPPYFYVGRHSHADRRGCNLHAPTPCLAVKDCRPTTLIGGKGLPPYFYVGRHPHADDRGVATCKHCRKGQWGGVAKGASFYSKPPCVRNCKIPPGPVGIKFQTVADRATGRRRWPRYQDHDGLPP